VITTSICEPQVVKGEVKLLGDGKNCLAIVLSISRLQCYLEGYRFNVVTDNLALKWFSSIESPTGPGTIAVPV